MAARLTRGVISRACKRRSSCSCLAIAAGDSEVSLDPAAVAATAVIIDDVPSLPGVLADDGTPLIVEQYGQRT